MPSKEKKGVPPRAAKSEALLRDFASLHGAPDRVSAKTLREDPVINA
jgi:hypothetical protein